MNNCKHNVPTSGYCYHCLLSAHQAETVMRENNLRTSFDLESDAMEEEMVMVSQRDILALFSCALVARSRLPLQSEQLEGLANRLIAARKKA